jgi:signal transduction histidine kinase/CHASE2 domain-containing sensor protein
MALSCFLALLLYFLLPSSDTRNDRGSMRFLNNAIFDASNRFLAKPVDTKIVIVEIDESSLGQIGRWPWKRAVHAKLIEQLGQTRNKVLLDVLFPEDSADDLVLAAAIRNHGQVYLPVAPQQDASGRFSPIYPVPLIGREAAGLGHAQFTLDSDGVVRGMHLSEGGFNAISELVAGKAEQDFGARDLQVAQARWDQKRYLYLPAISPNIERISYAKVLRGEVTKDYFSNKLVLVGATAKGLGDSYANSLVNRGALSPGIELHAVAINAQLNNTGINLMSVHALRVTYFFIFACVMVLLYRLRPGQAIAMSVSTIFFILGITVLSLKSQLWIAPGAIIVILALAYPLWSWRRLEATFSRLVKRAEELAGNPVRLPNMPYTSQSLEPIARSLQALDEAADYALTLRAFLRQVIDEIPYPVWVGDPAEKPLLTNAAALYFFPNSQTMDEALGQWLKTQFSESVLEDGKEYFLNDKSWLLRIQSFELPSDPINAPKLWLYQLVDITALRQTQRERDQMMHFLSHDMRSPQVSILSIMQQQTMETQSLPWMKDIRRQTRRTLALADGVVQLARAESAALRAEQISVDSLLAECSDAMWTAAHAKGVRLMQREVEQDVEVTGDPDLLRRALNNLVDNAVKFSSKDGLVIIEAKYDVKLKVVRITISDQGVGIADDQLNNVFKPYWRANDKVSGVGLGLSFVNLVATRHHGTMKVQKNHPHGCSFIMQLPANLS